MHILVDYGNTKISQHALKMSVIRMLKLDSVWKKRRRSSYYFCVCSQDCFRAFLQPEMMTGSCKWKCPQCRVERDAEKKIDIWKLPHILLIGLNR